jgi:AcrR family transcriptional regulator
MKGGWLVLDTFGSLPEEKRNRIINAAMSAFAVHGYKKASAADIAKAAGISKAMIFTYFGTKAGLYEYLTRLVLNAALNIFADEKDRLSAITDYFERTLLTAELKIGMMKDYPSIISFLASMLNERAPEARPSIDTLFSEAFKYRDNEFMAGINTEKFKNPGDIPRIYKITEWVANGAAEEWKGSDADTINEYMGLFADCLTALKNYFYKEEYL